MRNAKQFHQVPAGLIGAKIISFGAVDAQSREQLSGIEGGGLLIDYLPENSITPRRTILSFNELGTWECVSSDCACPLTTTK